MSNPGTVEGVNAARGARLVGAVGQQFGPLKNVRSESVRRSIILASEDEADDCLGGDDPGIQVRMVNPRLPRNPPKVAGSDRGQDTIGYRRIWCPGASYSEDRRSLFH